MKLTQAKHIQGYWWLPHNSEDKLPGVLHIEKDGGCKLELLGIFSNQEGIPHFFHNVNLPSIYGLTETGRPVTLEGSFYTKRNMNLPGISKCELHVGLAMLGVHINENDVGFDKIKISIDRLEEWLGISGLSFKFEEGKTHISYKKVDRVNYSVNDDFNLSIDVSGSVPSQTNFPDTTITQSACIDLIFIKPVSVANIKRNVFRLKNFMCFAFDQPTMVSSIVAFRSDVYHDFGEGKKRPKEIDIYYPLVPEVEKSPDIHHTAILFDYKEVCENLGEVLSVWYQKYEELEPAFNLYFAATGSRRQYLDIEFLLLVQGLEVFHRRTSNKSSYMDKASFKKIKQKMLDVCPDEYKDWFTQKMAHLNEINLRHRLEKLFEPFSHYYGDQGVINNLIDEVISTRNYLTHYDQRLEDKSTRGSDLFSPCKKMEVLFELHLLKEIGFTDAQIERIFNRNMVMAQKTGLKS